MNESYATTMLDENTSSTETPVLDTDKLKDLNIVTSISTSTTTTTNGEVPNSPPYIKQKLPKIAITAGKPWKYE